MRALSAEGVLGLNPSLVLAIEGAGPKETVAVLEAATVPLVRVPDRYTADGIVEKIKLIAEVAGEHDRGECLAGPGRRPISRRSRRCAQKIKQPKKVMFVLSLLNGKPMVAGRNTAADGIIRLAGGVNAIDAYEGYKQISDEAVIAAGPDTVLVMQRQQDTLDAATVFAHAAFAMTPAAAQKSFVAMDGLYLLGFGPRTATAARDLAAALYPALGRERCRPSERQAAAPDGDRRGRRATGRRALRSPVLVLGVLLVALAVAAAIAATRRRRRHSVEPPARRARPRAGRSRDRRARPARAVVDPAAAHRARHHDRRAARGRRHRDAGPVPQSARRSDARRHLARRGLRVGARDRGRRPDAGASKTTCRSRCCRSRRSRARWSRPIILYRLATRSGRTSIATLLLAGIAIGALANAGIGFLVFLADDRQLRDITFWLLGSLGGATWGKVAAIAPFVALMLGGLPFIARGLDLIVLGEAEAFHMGVAVERLKRIAIVLVAASTGAAVSVAGVIGFVGIVVPHLLRLVIGPGHRLLLPAALCLGAILLLVADTFARVVAAPAELPIGIVTAAIGAPFFLSLLLRQRALVG